MRDADGGVSGGIGCADAPPGDRPFVSYVHETDDYTRAVTGAHVETVRVGSGTAPNRVVGVPDQRLAVTECQIGFSMQARSQIPEDHVVATFMVDVGDSSKWCAVPLQPKTVLVYGPGVEHVAVNRPGLRFVFGIAPVDEVLEVAEAAKTRVAIPDKGSVTQLPVSDATHDWGHQLQRITDAVLAGRDVPSRDDAMHSFMRLVTVPATRASGARGRRLDSRKIVLECVEYARAIGRIPSVGELCTVANVSERRLRNAFTEECDEPPSRFFRAWALQEARRRLRSADPDATTVTEVAISLGFDHLGRFSGHYRRLYDETPSVTLQLSA